MNNVPGNSEQAEIPDVPQIVLNSSSKSKVLVSDSETPRIVSDNPSTSKVETPRLFSSSKDKVEKNETPRLEKFLKYIQ